jgi:SAM-dependent methyltransferase
MSRAMKFDDAASQKVEALYLTPEVVEQRCLVLKALQPKPGERVLDIGVGPGLLAFHLGRTVGPEGRVSGIDLSEGMLALARKRCAALPWIDLQKADALNLPFADESFDAAVSTQVYEYVADIPAALKDLHRVMRRGGRIAVLDTDYDSFVLHTRDEASLRKILSAWDEHFVHPGLPRVLTGLLRASGFAIRRREVFPMFNPDYHDNTFAKGLLAMMASFAVGRRGVTREDTDAWLAELEQLGKDGDFFFSLNRYLFVADKS